MVLWNDWGGVARWLLRKCGRAIRKVRRSEQGKRRRGFKPDAAAGSTRKPERNHIRLRGGGFHQYRKSPGLPQGGLRPAVGSSLRQNGFTTTRITMPIIKMVG